jgi:hypothetical protein
MSTSVKRRCNHCICRQIDFADISCRVGKKPSKGNIMSEYLESRISKEQLMAEADELVQRIDADAPQRDGRGASPAG